MFFGNKIIHVLGTKHILFQKILYTTSAVTVIITAYINIIVIVIFLNHNYCGTKITVEWWTYTRMNCTAPIIALDKHMVISH